MLYSQDPVKIFSAFHSREGCISQVSEAITTCNISRALAELLQALLLLIQSV